MRVRKLVPSRSRWTSCTTHNVVPGCEYVVREDQHEAYAAALPKAEADRIIVLPVGIEGIGATRQWMLEEFADETVVQFDDDVVAIHAHMTQRYKLEPHEVDVMIESTAECAIGAGCTLFGWKEGSHPIGLGYDQPFDLTTAVYRAIGVVSGRLSFVGLETGR